MDQNTLDNAYQQLLKVQEGVSSLYKQKGMKFKPFDPLENKKNSSSPVDSGKISTAEMNTLAPTLPTPEAGSAQTSLSTLLGSLGQQFGQTPTTFVSPTAETRSTLQNRILEIIGLQSKQGERLQQLQNEQNIFNKQQEVTDLENKYNSIARSYENAIRDTEVKSGGGLSGTRAAISKLGQDRDRQLADIAIQRSVALNDYQTANSIIDQKIAAEFEPLKSELSGLQNMYSMLQNDLTESEKIMVQANLQERQREVSMMQQTKTALSQALLENGKANLIAKLDQATSTSEMYQIAGQYGVPISTKLQNQLNSLQLQKAAKELAMADDQVIDDGSLAAYASQLADTGKIPSVSELKASGLTAGQVAAVAKQSLYANGTILSKSTGIKPSSTPAGLLDGITALYDLTQKVDQLKQLDEARIKGVIPAGIGKIFGTSGQANYLQLRQEIVDLLSRARSGAALTETEQKNYEALLPGRVGQGFFGLFGQNTQERIDNFSKVVQGSLTTKLNAENLVLNGYSKVKVGGIERTVGEILDIGGTKYRVLADGTLTDNI